MRFVYLILLLISIFVPSGFAKDAPEPAVGTITHVDKTWVVVIQNEFPVSYRVGRHTRTTVRGGTCKVEYSGTFRVLEFVDGLPHVVYHSPPRPTDGIPDGTCPTGVETYMSRQELMGMERLYQRNLAEYQEQLRRGGAVPPLVFKR